MDIVSGAGSLLGGWKYKTGYYYGTIGAGAVANKALANNTAYYCPFVVFNTQAFDRIAATVQAAGGAGSVVGLGVYYDSGGIPGNLFFDAGTIDGTSATAQTITIAQTLVAGVWWLCASVTGNASAPTLRAQASNLASWFCGHSAADSVNSASGYNGTGTNPLASTATVTNFEQNTPRVMLRAA